MSPPCARSPPPAWRSPSGTTRVRSHRRLIAFLVLATITDLREIRLPLVGIVTLSFVPVLASLVVFGLWEALLVAAVSGLATAWFTHDAQKVVFNVGNYVLSTFLAGALYVAVTPHHAARSSQTVLPLFGATAVDFFANTMVLAGVIALDERPRPRCASGGRTTSGACRAT